MQLLPLISDNDLYNLHTHTQYCDGHAPMREFVETAAARGFRVLGFSPHSPLSHEFKFADCDGGLPQCNMTFDSVQPYMAEVKVLQQDFPGVKLLTGMEIDYLGELWGPHSEYFKNLRLDYSIGSVHFIPAFDGQYVDIDGRYENFERKMTEHFDGDIRYVVETFYAQTLKMIEADGFDIIGHFDKIKDNGSHYMPNLEDTQWYNAAVDAVIDKIIESHLIVEINTKAWTRNRHLFPAQRHWRRLLQSGTPLIVNSDAHYPKLINASRVEALHALNYLKDKMAAT